MQIRLNASQLEDWARANRLSTKMVSSHFAPLNQLLQWLQCLSSESSIDGLISTVDTLRGLNPLQLRRAVRDYRYEVDETKMDDDCVEYLAQVEKQWERLQVQRRPADEPAKISSTEGDATAPAKTDGAVSPAAETVKAIDSISTDPASLAVYSPPKHPDSAGELLNSRHMVRCPDCSVSLGVRSLELTARLHSFRLRSQPRLSISFGSERRLCLDLSLAEPLLPHGTQARTVNAPRGRPTRASLNRRHRQRGPRRSLRPVPRL